MNSTTTLRNLLAASAFLSVVTAGSPFATSLAAEITTTWIDATTGNWSTPARWDTGVVPNNNVTDTYVVIINADGSYTLTLDLNPTINALTFDAVGATFFASQRLLTVICDTALTEGTVQWRGSAWNGTGTITNNTLFIAEGNSTVSSVFSNIDTFRLSSNGTIGESNLTLGPSFTNTGTVVLRNDDAGSGRLVTLTQSSGIFQNHAGGTLTTEQGPGLVGNTRNLTIANLQNAAAANVNINTDSNFNAVNGQFNNAGNLNVASGMRLNFQSGADLTHTGGTISLAKGANIQFNHSGGVYTQSGGALVMNGAGFVHGDGGATFTFNGGSINASASTRTDGHVFVRSGNLNFASATPLTGSATFYVTGPSNLAGNIPAGMTVRAASDGIVGEVTATVADSLTNHGTLTLANDDPSTNRIATFAMAAGKTLTNAGTIELIKGTGLGTANARQLNTDLVNNGTVNVSFNALTNRTNGLVTNNSAFNIVSPYALQSGTDFTQATGTLNVGDGGRLHLNHSGGVYTQSGGALVMNGAGFVHGDGGATFTFNGGSINASASTRTDGHVFVRSGNLNFASATPLTGSATFYVTGPSNLAGNIPAGMTVRAASDGIVGEVTATVADSLTNHGTLTLANDDPSTNRIATFAMAAGKTLTNIGTVDIIGGIGLATGGARTVTTILDNQGAFNVSFNATVGRAAAAHINSGTFAVAGGVTATIVGASFTNQPTGIVEGVGTINLASNNVAFTNQGTVRSDDAGTLTLANPAQVTNLSEPAATSTLTGGVWQAFTNSTLALSGINVVTNAADVTLSGPGSVFAAIDGIATNNGAFRVLANRNFTTAGPLTNNGVLQLGGGMFAASDLTNELAASLSGFGTVAVRPVNHGLIRANSGTLAFTNGIQGGSGTIQIDSGATLDLSGGTLDSRADLLVHSGAGLVLGAHHVLVDVNYTNANFGAGNAFNPRANVTGAGQINANPAVAQSLGGNVTNGTTSTVSMSFGNLHVGSSSTFNYQIDNVGASGPSLRGAIQTSAGGGSITDSRLSGAGVTAGNFGPVAAGANTGNQTVTFNATSAGALTGQQVRIVNNFDNVADQILQFTGAAYRFANPTAHAPEPVNFGIVHVGDAVQQALSITNNVPNDGFSERLNASIGSPTGAATTNDGSFTALLPAAINNTDLVVGINTATAGAKTGTATITLTSNGAGASGLANTPLTSQTVNVEAQVNNFAAANAVKLNGAGAFNMTGANQFTLDLGSTVEGQAPLVAELGVVNTAVAPADNLAGSFTLAVPGYSLSGFGPFTGLAAGNTRDNLMVQLNSTMAGTFTGEITLQPQSTNPRPFSMNLAPITIHLTGLVRLAGDYNQNGVVDAADYVVWRKNDGAQEGYNTWRANFGRTAASGATAGLSSSAGATGSASAAVPEPGTLVLLLAGAVVFLRSRRSGVKSA